MTTPYFRRLLAATRQCTTILISHRFSTVRHADRICVLEKGKVVDQQPVEVKAGTNQTIKVKR